MKKSDYEVSICHNDPQDGHYYDEHSVHDTEMEACQNAWQRSHDPGIEWAEVRYHERNLPDHPPIGVKGLKLNTVKVHTLARYKDGRVIFHNTLPFGKGDQS